MRNGCGADDGAAPRPSPRGVRLFERRPAGARLMFPVYLKEPGFEPPRDPIYYLVTRDGLFQVKENAAFRSAVRVQGLRWLEGQQEAVEWRLPPVPGELLGRVIGLFREVFRRYRSEAIVLLHYDPAGARYTLAVPEQSVAGGHLTYAIGPTPPGLLRVGTIHSHAGAEAFHSDLDDWDERHDDGLHVTVGELDGPASLSCSVVVDGRRFPVPARDVFSAVPRDGGAEVWWDALGHIHAEPLPRDAAADGKPSGI
jgi:hypothetical protein